MQGWGDRYGSTFPLGQSWDERTQSYNFSLYSHHARQVTLLLFREDNLNTPCLEAPLDPLVNKTGRFWHYRLPKERAAGARFYAYRVRGPHSESGFQIHSFDEEKLIVDPYAKCVYLPETFNAKAAQRPGSNMGQAALAVLSQSTSFYRNNHTADRPRHEHDLIVYEMHIRGFTRRENSGVSADKRGAYAGAIEKIPYLVDLGVTAVELMPVFQFNPQEGNYWGYNPLFFFTPHNLYSCSPGDPEAVRREFRLMVDAFHEAGIEVLLDVVYNHTGEGDQSGPKFCYKLVDESTYYMIYPDSHRYMNFSGVGNTLHCANPAVRRMIIDSMHSWVQDMGIDGFRFDLAAVLSRNSDGSINYEDPPLLGQIAGDPLLGDVRLIAEPWDLGSYQLGRVFRGIFWSQWNGRFRDGIQRYMRGDAGFCSEMARRVYGSDDLFPDTVEAARRPFQSINYCCSHDGLTLYDMVSYDKKYNWANGEDNLDGSLDYSWNCGHEGDEGAPPSVMELRRRQMKNFFLLLMLSNGIPMFRMGDEFAQTQHGNNNPWNQDNETSWLDWDRLNQFGDIHSFLKRAIAFRKAHPSVCRPRFWREDVAWHGVDGPPDWGPDSTASPSTSTEPPNRMPISTLSRTGGSIR